LAAAGKALKEKALFPLFFRRIFVPLQPASRLMESDMSQAYESLFVFEHGNKENLCTEAA
jgi:hypothetical protein